jgi:hypothetical protein
MALAQRFRDVVLDSAVRISDLTVDKVYPVIHAESVDTKYGLSLLLTIARATTTVSRCFYRADTACAFPKTTFRQ